uniref:3'-5' exonuclease domain-containing protein n=1 Tax=Chromera velia CCMP2878 TaxID=1169474 RepID=A0A0G4G1Z5_9ALVE|eukprot:Cvel_19712.t1-p1 / transcript=Cvel_19712.t1 / gene=Cvel_19712 / organism=Chromera_velia_CCMP2878 / gene_product=Ankyrin repeat, PH and SEC7 domain containing, putative / transcript_product=Ankyrin repeat, PH and SEC7 domain containing, putative / location=Cvel_scaffold1721:24562-34986(+) / protein_length=2063 / sequence_SO=supercontig / SO=protein_coding / is_pseudo=false
MEANMNLKNAFLLLLPKGPVDRSVALLLSTIFTERGSPGVPFQVNRGRTGETAGESELPSQEVCRLLCLVEPELLPTPSTVALLAPKSEISSLAVLDILPSDSPTPPQFYGDCCLFTDPFAVSVILAEQFIFGKAGNATPDSELFQWLRVAGQLHAAPDNSDAQKDFIRAMNKHLRSGDRTARASRTPKNEEAVSGTQGGEIGVHGRADESGSEREGDGRRRSQPRFAPGIRFSSHGGGGERNGSADGTSTRERMRGGAEDGEGKEIPSFADLLLACVLSGSSNWAAVRNSKVPPGQLSLWFDQVIRTPVFQRATSLHAGGLELSSLFSSLLGAGEKQTEKKGVSGFSLKKSSTSSKSSFAVSVTPPEIPSPPGSFLGVQKGGVDEAIRDFLLSRGPRGDMDLQKGAELLEERVESLRKFLRTLRPSRGAFSAEKSWKGRGGGGGGGNRSREVRPVDRLSVVVGETLVEAVKQGDEAGVKSVVEEERRRDRQKAETEMAEEAQDTGKTQGEGGGKGTSSRSEVKSNATCVSSRSAESVVVGRNEELLVKRMNGWRDHRHANAIGLVHMAASLCEKPDARMKSMAGISANESGDAENEETAGPEEQRGGHEEEDREGDRKNGAAEKGKESCRGVRMMSLLKQIGVDLYAKDGEDMTALFYAAFAGCQSCLEYLRANGLPIDAADHQGRTPLYWAACAAQPDACRWLLDRKADVNCSSVLGRSPVSKAAWTDLPEILKLLVDYGADLNVVDGKGRTCLHTAVWGESGGRRGKKFVGGKEARDSPECAALILAHPEGRKLMNVHDNDGATPLHVAASTNAVECLRLLLEAGADVETRALRSNFTPLMCAAYRGYLDCIQLLLERGADPSLDDGEGRTAAAYAVKGGNAEILGALLRHGHSKEMGGGREENAKDEERTRDALQHETEAKEIGGLLHVAALDGQAVCLFEVLDNASSSASLSCDRETKTRDSRLVDAVRRPLSECVNMLPRWKDRPSHLLSRTPLETSLLCPLSLPFSKQLNPNVPWPPFSPDQIALAGGGDGTMKPTDLQMYFSIRRGGCGLPGGTADGVTDADEELPVYLRPFVYAGGHVLQESSDASEGSLSAGGCVSDTGEGDGDGEGGVGLVQGKGGRDRRRRKRETRRERERRRETLVLSKTFQRLLREEGGLHFPGPLKAHVAACQRLLVTQRAQVSRRCLMETAVAAAPLLDSSSFASFSSAFVAERRLKGPERPQKLRGMAKLQATVNRGGFKGGKGKRKQSKNKRTERDQVGSDSDPDTHGCGTKENPQNTQQETEKKEEKTQSLLEEMREGDMSSESAEAHLTFLASSLSLSSLAASSESSTADKDAAASAAAELLRPALLLASAHGWTNTLAALLEGITPDVLHHLSTSSFETGDAVRGEPPDDPLVASCLGWGSDLFGAGASAFALGGVGASRGGFSQGHSECVRLLLEKGWSPKRGCSSGVSALEAASMSGNVESLEALMTSACGPPKSGPGPGPLSAWGIEKKTEGVEEGSFVFGREEIEQASHTALRHGHSDAFLFLSSSLDREIRGNGGTQTSSSPLGPVLPFHIPRLECVPVEGPIVSPHPSRVLIEEWVQEARDAVSSFPSGVPSSSSVPPGAPPSRPFLSEGGGQQTERPDRARKEDEGEGGRRGVSLISAAVEESRLMVGLSPLSAFFQERDRGASSSRNESFPGADAIGELNRLSASPGESLSVGGTGKEETGETSVSVSLSRLAQEVASSLKAPSVRRMLQKEDVKFVDKQEGLSELVGQFEADFESGTPALLGVDVEYFSLGTGAGRGAGADGYVCLVQLSSLSRTAVVDVMRIRAQDFAEGRAEGSGGGSVHSLLQPVMNNPNVLKIFHGAASDLQWLQTDFDLQVCNLFDTYRAAQLLREETAKNVAFQNAKKRGGLGEKGSDPSSRVASSVEAALPSPLASVLSVTSRKEEETERDAFVLPPGDSLSALVRFFFRIPLPKAFQRADWRVRPLPPPMLLYAAHDAYFLPLLAPLLLLELVRRAGLRGVAECVIGSNRQTLKGVLQERAHGQGAGSAGVRRRFALRFEEQTAV